MSERERAKERDYVAHFQNFIANSMIMWRMDSEAIPLDNKIYNAGQNQKNFGILKINTCCKNRKNVL